MQRTRWEDLLDKYQQMIRTYKNKSNKVIASGIIHACKLATISTALPSASTDALPTYAVKRISAL